MSNDSKSEKLADRSVGRLPRTFNRSHVWQALGSCVTRFLMASVFLTSVLWITIETAKAELLEYTAGHSDVNLSYSAGDGLLLRSFFGANAVLNGNSLSESQFVDPANLVIRVPDAAEFGLLPGDEGPLGFTGFVQGNRLWLLPELSTPGIPFLGLNASDLPSNEWSPQTTWTVTDISAPVGGYFSLWQWSAFPPANTPLLSTFDPSVGLTYEKPTLAHQHYNWGFTAEGVYDVELVVSATRGNDVFSTQPTVLRFLVGDATAVPEPTSLALLGVGTCMIGVRWGRRKRKAKQLAEVA